MVVDDDPQARELVTTILNGSGYSVVAVANGEEALRVAEDPESKVSVLLADMLLPDKSGFDTAAEIRQVRPELPIIFMSGYIEGDIIERAVTELGAKFLDKPFSPQDLVARVRSAAGH
jgi:CheY-like chemotaxis protein